MKDLKMLGLLAVVGIVALTAFAGTASATTLTSPTGTIYTGGIHAKSVGHLILHTPIGTIECNTTIEGSVKSHGSGLTAVIPLSTLHLTSCTGTYTVTTPVAKPGSLEVHWNSGSSGIVTWTGAELTYTSHAFGGTCIYTTNGTRIGTLTGGTPAKIDVESGVIPRTGGTLGAFCGSTGTWTGSFEITKPTTLSIDS